MEATGKSIAACFQDRWFSATGSVAADRGTWLRSLGTGDWLAPASASVPGRHRTSPTVWIRST